MKVKVRVKNRYRVEGEGEDERSSEVKVKNDDRIGTGSDEVWLCGGAGLSALGRPYRHRKRSREAEKMKDGGIPCLASRLRQEWSNIFRQELDGPVAFGRTVGSLTLTAFAA